MSKSKSRQYKLEEEFKTYDVLMTVRYLGVKQNRSGHCHANYELVAEDKNGVVKRTEITGEQVEAVTAVLQFLRTGECWRLPWVEVETGADSVPETPPLTPRMATG